MERIMKTQDQILAELLADPQHATMTKMLNGELVPMSEDERLQTLTEWAESQSQHQIKIWQDVQQFMAEFTMPEKAQIAMSTDPTIAALRFELTTWLSNVCADDARVIAGLNKLVELGIITEERKTEILNFN
jgi:hypothetical protein